MKVVRMHDFGEPEVLALEDEPIPHPHADEVLVRVSAASINPVDYKMRSGGYVEEAPEKIQLGRDIAGTVEQCGADVTRFRPGDRVFAMLPRDRAGYAEYVAVKAAYCVRVPECLSDAEAAAVPLAAITAWQGLFDHGGLTSGQHVLVHGGGGGVGHFAIQLAHAAGARVSTTVSEDDLAFARELGADQVIDYKAERFEDRVDHVDLVFDLVSGLTQDRSFGVLREGGVLVSSLTEPSHEMAREHHVRATNFMAQPNARELEQVSAWISQGKVRPMVDAQLPLEEVANAQRILETEHVQGKIVLQMH